MIHWDGSISLGNLITIAVIVFPLVRQYLLQRDFPPHRHNNGSITYPKGMSPEKVVVHQKEK